MGLIPKHPKWLMILLGALALACVVGVNLLFRVDSSVSDVVARTHEIPPVFDNYRWLYGSVLALLMGGTLLGMGVLLDNVRFLQSTAGRWHEPAKVSVLNETILVLSFVLATFGDVLVLLAWGEAAAPANSVLNRTDRLLDACSVLTFVAWLLRRERSRPVLVFQLLQQPFRMDLQPTWQQLRPKLIIGVGVLVVAFGVAFGK